MTAARPVIDPVTAVALQAAITPERLSSYLAECGGDLPAALELYRWNGEMAGALWETLGHVEVLLRNTLCARMDLRQRRSGRPASWLADAASGLDQRARDDIAVARARVKAKGKRASDGQIISELGFGFWRFLLARRYQSSLWPDLAGGFPNAPTRRLSVVENPMVRLHAFRNRLAHQQRIWSEPIEDRYDDCILLSGFVDASVATWIDASSSVSTVFAARPRP